MAKRAAKYNKRWTPEYATAVLAEADRSGLSDRAFAKAKGIDPQRLWWWRKRLATTAAVTKEDDGFVEVAVRQPPGPKLSERVEILLTNGRIVAVSVNVDPDALGRLLDAAEGQRC